MQCPDELVTTLVAPDVVLRLHRARRVLTAVVDTMEFNLRVQRVYDVGIDDPGPRSCARRRAASRSRHCGHLGNLRPRRADPHVWASICGVSVATSQRDCRRCPVSPAATAAPHPRRSATAPAC